MSGQSKKLDSKVPTGPVQKKWDKHKFEVNLLTSNKRKFNVIVVGTGLAEGCRCNSCPTGYNVQSFVSRFTRRAGHSIAAQGGINAAKTTPTTATQCGGFLRYC